MRHSVAAAKFPIASPVFRLHQRSPFLYKNPPGDKLPRWYSDSSNFFSNLDAATEPTLRSQAVEFRSSANSILTGNIPQVNGPMTFAVLLKLVPIVPGGSPGRLFYSGYADVPSGAHQFSMDLGNDADSFTINMELNGAVQSASFAVPEPLGILTMVIDPAYGCNARWNGVTVCNSRWATPGNLLVDALGWFLSLGGIPDFENGGSSGTCGSFDLIEIAMWQRRLSARELMALENYWNRQWPGIRCSRSRGELLVRPAVDFAATVAEGEAVADTKTYVIENIGDEPISWTATPSEAWLNATPASGRLGAGESANLLVSFNAGTNDLFAGQTYPASVAIPNITTSLGNTSVAVALTVT